MNWADVVACARQHFAVVITGEQWFGIRYSATADDPDAVKIRVAGVRALDLPHVLVVAEVFAADVLDPAAALQLNHTLQVGALEIEDQKLLLRQLLPATGLDELTLRRTILYIARQTEHMRKLSRVPAQHSLFDHLVD
ncbi:MAG: hypothetical protein K8W52_33035 [Deltaproteobacteria bacterium]|nr:hypothetical protein [Deltaproteobacteria bacterium]